MLTDKEIRDAGINLWQLNDIETWAGFSLEETILHAVKETGVPREELVESPRKIPLEKWDSLLVIEEGPYMPRYTYRNSLEKSLNEGVELPFLFASTEY